MGSEAPCRGGGLSHICLLITHFLFKILTTPQTNIFCSFHKILNISSPFFIQYKHLKNHPKILKTLMNKRLQLNGVIC